MVGLMKDVDERQVKSELDEISRRIETILKNIDMAGPEKSVNDGVPESGQGM